MQTQCSSTLQPAAAACQHKEHGPTGAVIVRSAAKRAGGGGRSKRGLRRRYAHYPQGLLVIFSGSMGNKCKSHSRVSPWPMAVPNPDARVAAAAADAGQKN